MTSADQIQLELPADAQYGRLARIAAAHLALRRGFSVREIDDLRLVMDEAMALLDGSGEGVLRVDYDGDTRTIVVDARLTGTGDRVMADERVAHFGRVAGDLVDSFDVDADDHRVRFTKKRA